ncbi:hypothetical protein JIN85_17580 [Luteolibacter pohnpeiensis]|uniref:Uncharacterized protein n=1 Tax=Luteolibacter pohnpeiensis TaxID=454153 RepID=A0A934SA78_9BACT|nr:hypothetical protein [Luteolibacter pohnpeiensis]MBK1884235.1 hypothetical protein [Luteolibacter pohnpeiensis]
MSEVTFGVKLITLNDMLKVQDGSDVVPSFLIFTARAAENLGKRLLWIDAEVEFCNGAVRKFKNFSFHLLTKGIEADVKKLDDFAFQGFILPGDAPRDGEAPNPIEITKLKITNSELK